jgi:DNA integrity scanning protein DisA with diadenylate cyclase activity
MKKKIRKKIKKPILSDHSKFSIRLDEICERIGSSHPETIRQVMELAIELAREGREGRKIGTIFVIGDVQNVLAASKPLILDPLYGHDEEKKSIFNANMSETVKELAQLDGAFVISDKGIVVSAARYLDSQSKNIDLPLGLGTRHMAAASITRDTESVAIVVSESSIVRILFEGKIVTEILPELWLLQRARSYYADMDVEELKDENIAIISDKEEDTGN